MRTIGIDLGVKGEHKAVIVDEGGRFVGPILKFTSTPKALSHLLEEAQKGNSDGQVQAVMEPTGMAWYPVAVFLIRAGVKAVSRRAVEGDRLVKRMSLTRLDTGATRQAMESVRIYLPAELNSMGLQAGLRLRRAMGTYAGGAFTPESPRWIGLFERVQSPHP